MNDCRAIMNFRRLRFIERYNSMPRLVPEDVAQHSYYVTLLAMKIGDDMRENGEDVDIELLMRKAMVHDIPECLTGDVLYTTKHHNHSVSEGVAEAEDDMMNGLLEGTSGILQSYKDIMKSSKDGLEGSIVAIADLLELGIYCYEEVGMGNRAFMGPLEKIVNMVLQFPASSTDTVSNMICMLRGSSNLNFSTCFHDGKIC